MGYFGNIFGLTFGPVQCRFAEALTVLPFLAPVTSWGLFIGCLTVNILSPYGPLDMVVGSARHPHRRPPHRPVPQQVAGPPAPGTVQRAAGGGGHRLPEVGFTAAFPGCTPTTL